jgi:uncharacterized peroxidase-related enzyme
MLAGTKKLFGFIPSPVARLVTQPTVAGAFVQMNGLWEHTALTPLEREVVIMVVAVENQCSYCVAMHSAMLARRVTAPTLIQALRAGDALADQRLEALALFTRALMKGRGEVPENVWAQFRGAGYDHAAALEVVLGVATYTLSTFANRLTQAPLDVPFAEFRWSADSSPPRLDEQRLAPVLS